MGNTPNVRFKGFTEDWEQRKLSDCAGFRRGSFPQPYGNKEWYDGEGAMPFVQVADVSNDMKLVNDTKQKISKLAQPMSVFAEEGSVLVTLQGSIGRVAITQYGAFVDRTVLIFDKYKDGIDKRFWAYIIKEKFEDEARKAPGGTIKTITKEALSEFDLMLPSYAEQRKLADYLLSLDHLITLHQQKCDETKEFKKYMLQNMFPQKDEKVPKIRFDGFTGDWEQRKLEDFGKATGGTSIESEFSEDGIYKVISIGSYSENSVYNDQGIRAIKSDKTNNRVLNRNDLTMILNDKTTSGNIIGRVLLIEESGIYVYNQRTERIEINLDEYDPVFLYEMLNAPNIREKIIKQAQGNTQIYVNWTAISLLEYMIPSKEEQVKIGEYLHSIGNLITLHQQKCNALKEFKKYMLQNMFPQKGENKCQN
jgi:type I restriction enzyme S subunit